MEGTKEHIHDGKGCQYTMQAQVKYRGIYVVGSSSDVSDIEYELYESGLYFTSIYTLDIAQNVAFSFRDSINEIDPSVCRLYSSPYSAGQMGILKESIPRFLFGFIDHSTGKVNFVSPLEVCHWVSELSRQSRVDENIVNGVMVESLEKALESFDRFLYSLVLNDSIDSRDCLYAAMSIIGWIGKEFFSDNLALSVKTRFFDHIRQLNDKGLFSESEKVFSQNRGLLVDVHSAVDLDNNENIQQSGVIDLVLGIVSSSHKYVPSKEDDITWKKFYNDVSDYDKMDIADIMKEIMVVLLLSVVH